MEDIRNLEDILLILKKQDEIDRLEQQISELTQELSQTREQLDESLGLNEDLTKENKRLTELITSLREQNRKLQIQIDILKSYQSK